VTLGTALLLFAVAWLVARRTFSTAVAAGSVCVLALMPALGEIASGVIGDVLFAALMVLATHLLGACQGRRASAWMGAGAVVGLAYLTKGNGHLTLVALFTLSAVLHRRRLLARPDLYAAGAGFVTTALFLLWRNRVVYGNPFHNFNDHSAWLDGWKETWAYLHSQEWNRIGLGWYLHRHSVGQLVWRVTQGFGKTVGALVYTSGLGITAATPADRDATVAEALPRVLTGLGLLALAALGLRDRHRAGHRAEVLAVAHVVFWFVLAFAVGGQGVGMAARFMLPITAILVPHAAFALVARSRRWVEARPAIVAVIVVPLALKLLWFAPGAAANPRAAYAVPADWAQTSSWLAGNLRPGERYAIAHTSLYSTWDRPRPDPDARWIGLFTAPAGELLREMAHATPLSIAPRWDGPPIPVTKVLIDTQDRAFATYADKLSTARDPQGPLQFLGWPRCFADSGRPSRFSIYCRP
jgi:4-amino-4-deoxy-L-arabinose transferase-like glycosyltransferase